MIFSYVSWSASLFKRPFEGKPFSFGVLLSAGLLNFRTMSLMRKWVSPLLKTLPDEYIANSWMHYNSFSTTSPAYKNANSFITGHALLDHRFVLPAMHEGLLHCSKMLDSSLLTISIMHSYCILALTTHSWSPQLRKSRNSGRFSPMLSMHDRTARTFTAALPMSTSLSCWIFLI